MLNRARVVSPANIAFVKYWGRRNDALILPLNSSNSMNLDSCTTTTSVEWGGEDDSVRVKYFGKDELELDGTGKEKVLKVVERIRGKLGVNDKIRIVSENSFPEAAGVASSAAAFSALTLAIYKSLGVDLSEKELTIETRLSGSGSACRSIPSGFVVWHKGEKMDGSDSFAESIATPEHWELADLICLVGKGNKKVSSVEGHARADGPYMKARLVGIEERVTGINEAILARDIEKLGRYTETEAVSLHAVAMLSEPPIFYWNGLTVEIMQRVMRMREEEKIQGFFTMDAGANVHIICENRDVNNIKEIMEKEVGVREFIIGRPTTGAKVV